MASTFGSGLTMASEPSSVSSASTCWTIAPSMRVRWSTAPSSSSRLTIWLTRRGMPPEAA
jgi:hypothetical protein